MCFNFEAAFPKLAAARMKGLFDVEMDESLEEFKASVYPKKMAPVVAHFEESLKYSMAGYSLIPEYMKTDKIEYSTYNSRDDKAAESKTFRKYFKESRCLVPMVAYYEYSGSRGSEGRKIYRSAPGDERIIFAAGLFSVWKDDKNNRHPTFAVMTTEPTKQAKKFYERMPVFLEDKYWEMWLDRKFSDTKALREICQPWEETKMIIDEIKRKPKAKSK